ncbi:hypothetical protein BD626DRAFT_489139 [Schizophyllum amplum]|uniref:Uncharacterized protein n=1 Tax=Schizophyllum amplum TaxID=97359 RepID=A0A550CLD3_9AGAR|nr:hypothetical protein BD626DRAFT_489139 [Auriculariopsis ampla]
MNQPSMDSFFGSILASSAPAASTYNICRLIHNSQLKGSHERSKRTEYIPAGVARSRSHSAFRLTMRTHDSFAIDKAPSGRLTVHTRRDSRECAVPSTLMRLGVRNSMKVDARSRAWRVAGVERSQHQHTGQMVLVQAAWGPRASRQACCIPSKKHQSARKPSLLTAK